MNIRHTMMTAAAAMAALSACTVKPTSTPPLLGPNVPRRSLEATYTRLRVKIAAFKDRTTYLGGVSDLDTGPFFRSGSKVIAGPPADSAMKLETMEAGGTTLVQTLPDAIAGVLGQSGRFEVMASGDECDVLLFGALTATKGGEATLDMRLISCFTKSDMASVTTPIRFSSGNNEVQASRDDIKAAVAKLVGELPDPKSLKKGKILSRDGNYVTINMGREDKVMKGMKAFAVTYGDRIVDEKSGEMLGDEVFTGDLYAFAVYGKITRAWIVDERNTKTKVGDYVIFK